MGKVRSESIPNCVGIMLPDLKLELVLFVSHENLVFKEGLILSN